MTDTTMRNRRQTAPGGASPQRSTSERSSETRRRRMFRLLAVAGAIGAALGLWAIIELGFGFDLRSPGEAFGGGKGTSDVGPAQVIIASAVGSLTGWALLAFLERFTRARAAWWVGIALLALLASLGGPLSGIGIAAGNRVALVSMHLLVAAIVIPALYLSSPARGHAPRAETSGD
jgi:Family of unknown function (DUF6069)